MGYISPTDYKTANIAGKERVNGFSGSNPLNGLPTMTFSKEYVTHDKIMDKLMTNASGSCAVDTSDMTKVIPRRNILDGSLTGATFTLQEALEILFSLGWQTMYEADIKALEDRKAIAQAAYDADPSQANLDALNAAIAAVEAAI